MVRGDVDIDTVNTVVWSIDHFIECIVYTILYNRATKVLVSCNYLF